MIKTGPVMTCSLPHVEVISLTAASRRARRSSRTERTIARGMSSKRVKTAMDAIFRTVEKRL